MLSRLQQRVLEALACEHPAEFLARVAREDGELNADERRALGALDGDGLRLTRRVLQKLRFQRLASDPELARWSERDPRGFARAFEAYDRSVPARSLFPADEVAAFREFQDVPAGPESPSVRTD